MRCISQSLSGCIWLPPAPSPSLASAGGLRSLSSCERWLELALFSGSVLVLSCILYVRRRDIFLSCGRGLSQNLWSLAEAADLRRIGMFPGLLWSIDRWRLSVFWFRAVRICCLLRDGSIFCGFDRSISLNLDQKPPSSLDRGLCAGFCCRCGILPRSCIFASLHFSWPQAFCSSCLRAFLFLHLRDIWETRTPRLRLCRCMGQKSVHYSSQPHKKTGMVHASQFLL